MPASEDDLKFKIEELWAFVIVDEDNEESIPAISLGDMMYPLVMADRVRLEQFRPAAQGVARQYQRPVKLVRFTSRIEEEVLHP